MFIARLETPTEPPYAVGSTHAGDMLVSSDQTVVGVDPAGNLVAHRNGKASIRATGGAALEVTVQAVRSLQIRPSRLEIEPGKKQDIEVTAEQGEHVAPGSIRWRTTDPNIAVVVGSTVQAGMTQGTAALSAELGDANADLTVVVRARPQPKRH
jgi:hypothetical protein